jgi:hypothetical protein
MNPTPKPKIAFFLCGEARCNPLSFRKNITPETLESFTKYIFTDEFKSKYDYTIYISADNVHLENTTEYFGKEHITNIHLLDTDYYLKPVQDRLPNQWHFLEAYNQHPNPKQYRRYPTSVLQHYKLLDAFNMYQNDPYECDYIVRMRFDCIFHKDILDVLTTFQANPDQQIVASSDHFAVGKPNIMQTYCSLLLHKFGTYTFDSNITYPVQVYNGYSDLPNDTDVSWTYAPEVQLFEGLFEYCKTQSLDIDRTMLGMNCCKIVR